MAGAAGLAALGGVANNACAANAQYTVVARGLGAPEGPKWLADGSILVCEMARGFLSRVLPGGKVEKIADLGGSPNGVAIGPDGAAYVAETNQKFDVILVDSTDPQGPGIVLFQAPFFRNCRRVMNPGGVMVTQNGVYFYQQDELRDAHKHRLKVFKKAGAYVGPIPTYVGGHMAFGWASDTLDFPAVPVATIRKRFKAAGLTTQYYNPDVHQAFFCLPNNIRPLIGMKPDSAPAPRAKGRRATKRG